MTPTLTITVMIAVCLIMVLVLFFAREGMGRAFGKLCLRCAVGGGAIALANVLAGFVGMATGVGLNVISVAFVGLLGAPGFVTLYAAQLLLPK